MVVRVGGAASGAGTSTVALALAALVAWRGLRTLVVAGDDLVRLCVRAPWTGPGAAELALLPPEEVALELGRVARPVPGVAGLAVVGGAPRASDGPWPPDVTGWPVDAVVVDLGVAGATGVLVTRPDAGLRAAAAATGPVVLNGAGPVPDRVAHAALGGRPAARQPWSARVARAGAAGRIPSAVPGRWLHGLVPVVADLLAVAPREG